MKLEPNGFDLIYKGDSKVSTYIFASVRGEDFEIEADSPTDAFISLLEREKYNGTLWRLNDPYYNKAMCRTQGFQTLNKDDYEFNGPVYKEKL